MYGVKRRIGDEVIEFVEGQRLIDYCKILLFTLSEMGRQGRVLSREGI